MRTPQKYDWEQCYANRKKILFIFMNIDFWYLASQAFIQRLRRISSYNNIMMANKLKRCINGIEYISFSWRKIWQDFYKNSYVLYLQNIGILWEYLVARMIMSRWMNKNKERSNKNKMPFLFDVALCWGKDEKRTPKTVLQVVFLDLVRNNNVIQGGVKSTEGKPKRQWRIC